MTTTQAAAQQRACRRAQAGAIQGPKHNGTVLHQRIIVALRHTAAPPSDEEASRIGVVRRIAAAKLRYCGLKALVDNVMLIVSELLTNALLHSGTTEIRLDITVEGQDLCIAVHDGMAGHAVPKITDDDAESGRGLQLIDVLIRENGGCWGTSEGGATTWCRLAIPDEGTS
ncbi:ATP-binding protein [Streptomyces coerulescens]|uniref:ATP-binding protein n=1 Tax=Streptomyces coerulescens TaxID=29304 RepID=A0ABW0CX06_STRCD